MLECCWDAERVDAGCGSATGPAVPKTLSSYGLGCPLAVACVCRIGGRSMACGLNQRAFTFLGILDVSGQQLLVGHLGMARTCLGVGSASVLPGSYEHPRPEEGRCRYKGKVVASHETGGWYWVATKYVARRAYFTGASDIFRLKLCP